MIYASRSALHKTPFGAVRAGEAVTFTLTPLRALAWSGVTLCVSDEFGGKYTEYPLRWRGLRRDCDLYEVTLDTAELLGPVWYWFRFALAGGGSGIYDNPGTKDDGEGEVSSGGEARAWQQTVTLAGAEEPPDWFGRGVTYHIFPDRFRKGGANTPPLASMPGERVLHKNWGDCPDFLPDANGEVRNRDFYGGNIAGVLEKLPYLRSLGVNTVYFSPVFEAASNHRYDTACYTRIDPLFGTEEEFSLLCAKARELGIRIILDGVFNHTGYNSEYFNGAGFYGTVGAKQSKASPYYRWYNFSHWPDEYEAWWGVYTLPQVNEADPEYIDFIVRGKDSVVRRWLRAGAGGWRLDVADELPDSFIAALRDASREEKPDAVIIGEVWEDASNKVAYGVRRQYLLGRELDGVMNYPLRNCLIGYILGGDAAHFKRDMETLREHYPRGAYQSLMNALGTHDTPRILTVLGATPEEWSQTKEERAETFLPPERRELAIRRLMVASALLYTFPGSPCVLYGDEAGLEGFEDPFNRRGYPWGSEEKRLLRWYAALGALRGASEALQAGEIQYITADRGILAYERIYKNERVLICANRGDNPGEAAVRESGRVVLDKLSGQVFRSKSGTLTVPLEPLSVRILM
ncbi:MAG: glycoside hydrolase family 13 protein [Oscillospiraceae bacterium]|jgi:glycosidase|nr:glycoside hydrolase family 13 protein [Oscillospiraceae bacterium]